MAWSEVWIAVAGFVLNAIREFAQSPLYADHTKGVAHILWTRFHCALGDVLILIVSFWVTSIALRSRKWPVQHPIIGGTLFTMLGLVYTIWSEWFNTGIKGAWQYAPSMPTIAGIGVTLLCRNHWVALVYAWACRMQNRPV